MTIDALVLLGENRFGPTLLTDEVLTACDDEGIDAIIAAPARPLGYHLEPANDALAEQRDISDGRVAMLGRIDPLDGEAAVSEAVRCIDELGARGLFLHPAEECFPIARALPVAEVAADREVPLVVATGYLGLSEPLQVGDLAAHVPNAAVVMTTGGQINISGLSMIDAWSALQRHDNLHVMTNGEYRQDFIEQLARDFDHTRVLYGSFAPAFDLRFERRRITSARMTDDARRAIEHHNAARLYRTSDD